MNQGIIVEALRSIAYYLTSAEKRKAIVIFFLLLVSSVLDVFGLASLVPVIMIAAEPQNIPTNKYFGPVYQALNFQNERAFLVFLIIAIFVFFLFKNLFTTWINFKQVKFTAHVALTIIRRQYNKYTNLPFWQFTNEGSAKLINNVLGVPQYYVSSVIRPMFILLAEIAIIAVIVIGILIYQPILFLILVIVLVPTAILTYQLLKKRSEQIGKRSMELRPPSYAILTNTFNGFVELKLANKLPYFQRKLFTNQHEVQELDAKAYLYTLIPLKMIEMVAILGVVTIFLFALFFEESAGNLIAIIGLFAAAAYRLMPSVNRLLTSMVTLKQSAAAITELQLFREYELNKSKQESNESILFSKEIRLENITFRFPGSLHPTINNLNLVIKKGEKVGIIGSSGSGKTTLMNLLLRFYKEEKGQIHIDGIRLNENNKASWYQNVGYVKQDTFLMESSVKDNITLMDEEVDGDKLNSVLEQASLKEFVESLPDGVETLIGERGAKLSGGQKQRIGIARALYKNAQVLLLDEATSALDSKTEREVNEAIARLTETDITIIIIAHRITTLRDCDRIYEMKNGEIVSERSYEEVIKEVI